MWEGMGEGVWEGRERGGWWGWGVGEGGMAASMRETEEHGEVGRVRWVAKEAR